MDQSIHVLHVEDDPDFADLVSTFLQRVDDRITVRTETTPTHGFEILTQNDFDCIVSDYDMPDQNGIEFLEVVRDDYPDLPFILYTGKGSEEVASEAISAGVTDYLQKESGTDQYAVLANRIVNAVEALRFERVADRRQHQLEQILKTVPGCIVRIDYDGQFIFANQRAKDVLGLEPADVAERTYNDPKWKITDLDGEPIPDEELPFRQVRDSGEAIYGFRHMVEWPDGTRKALQVNGAPLFDDEGNVKSTVFALTDITDHVERERELEELEEALETILSNVPIVFFAFDEEGVFTISRGSALESLGLDPGQVVGESVFEIYDDHPEIIDQCERALDGEQVTATVEVGDRIFQTWYQPLRKHGSVSKVVGHSYDITQIRRRERELERQNEQLDAFANVVSHDLRNPLSVAEGRLEMAREEYDSEHLDDVARAHDRMNLLIDDLLDLARAGDLVSETERFDLADCVETSWQNINTAEATLEVQTTGRIEADRSRLHQLLDNLFRNAIQHGGEDVTVTVGDLDAGFYIEDDGPGIPPGERENVFEAEYSSNPDGTGFGLSIAKRIVNAHNWEITVTESEEGGARFEITDIQFVEE